jgi:hypothetical protein
MKPNRATRVENTHCYSNSQAHANGRMPSAEDRFRLQRRLSRFAAAMSASVKVSDAGPEGRGVPGPAFESLPRRKPRTGRALFWLGATYGDLRIACGSGVWAQWRVARSLAGGTDDGERIRLRGCACLAQTWRSKEHWRPREDISFCEDRGVHPAAQRSLAESPRRVTFSLSRSVHRGTWTR